MQTLAHIWSSPLRLTLIIRLDSQRTHHPTASYLSHQQAFIMSKEASPTAKSQFVTLESSDGYTFVVSRQIACASGTLRTMLDEDGKSCDQIFKPHYDSES